jgi:hypothetical protein
MVIINISKIALKQINKSLEVEVELSWSQIKFSVSKILFIKILLNKLIHEMDKRRSQAVELVL